MLGRKKRRDQSTDSDSPADVYTGLRAMALSAGSRGLVATSPDHPDVAGLVADVHAKGGFATIVALADGTTSMYTSTGGGTIGAGTHEAVSAATRRLLAVVQQNLSLFTTEHDHELPPEGLNRFHALTSSAVLSVDIPENAFWGRATHELLPVIAQVQNVISAISAASPS